MYSFLSSIREWWISTISWLYFLTMDKKRFQGDVWKRRYEMYRGCDLSAFITPHWQSVCDKLALNSFKPDFLSYKFIRNTMTFYDPEKLPHHIAALKKEFGSKTSHIIHESPVGKPRIVSTCYHSSHTTIMHANHALEFKQRTGKDIWHARNIVEWGGGYGDLARMLKQPSMTYTIIDLPLFCFTQASYLSSIPELADKINMITDVNMPIREGYINLVPLNPEVIRALKFDTVDVFVSTWALSESGKAAQDLVRSCGYFGAEYILIGHQRRGETMPYAESMDLGGYDILYHKPPAHFTDEDRYLFARRKSPTAHQ